MNERTFTIEQVRRALNCTETAVRWYLRQVEPQVALDAHNPYEPVGETTLLALIAHYGPADPVSQDLSRLRRSGTTGWSTPAVLPPTEERP